ADAVVLLEAPVEVALGEERAGGPNRAFRRVPLEVTDGSVDEARADPARQVHHDLVIDAQGPEDEVPVEIPAGAELEQPSVVDRSESRPEGGKVVWLRGAALPGGGECAWIAAGHVALEERVRGPLHRHVLEDAEGEGLEAPVPEGRRESSGVRHPRWKLAHLH